MHHEVGTHLLTYCNGRAQPLRLFSIGLPGYDELQEGLAVLAEYLSGGLTPGRLRTLAARVVAVRRLVEGAAFEEAFQELTGVHGFSPRIAFNTTMRVYRGGGFTKDAVYLRGLVRLLEYLRAGGEIEPLFVGKVSLEYIPVVAELLWREVLDPPALLPRYLETDDARRSMQRLRGDVSVLQLAET